MNPREFDPARLDVPAFAKAGAELSGVWPMARFARLRDIAVTEGGAVDESQVTWRARGETRAARGGAPEIRLHLVADANVLLECQRCLAPVVTRLEISRSFLFVHGEDAAARLDAETDDDVLALTPALDLAELIEDELVLALPIVPRHEECPEPLVAPEAADAAAESPNPFAALAGLKRGGSLN